MPLGDGTDSRGPGNRENDDGGDQGHQHAGLSPASQVRVRAGVPMAHTMAAMTSPATQAMSPMESSAPTMVLKATIPGRPVVFGVTFAMNACRLGTFMVASWPRWLASVARHLRATGGHHHPPTIARPWPERAASAQAAAARE